MRIIIVQCFKMYTFMLTWKYIQCNQMDGISVKKKKSYYYTNKNKVNVSISIK